MGSQRGVRAGVVLSLLAISALTGCATAEPGVAAYVDGSRITDQQVTDAVKGISGTLSEGQQVSTPAVVNALIHGEISEHLAAQHNIAITDSERNTVLKGSNLEPFVSIPAARPVAYDVADQQIVSAKLGSAAYLAAVAKQQVKLNPRYGVLDPAQQLIVSDESGSLAKPGTPTPEPPQ